MPAYPQTNKQRGCRGCLARERAKERERESRGRERQTERHRGREKDKQTERVQELPVCPQYDAPAGKTPSLTHVAQSCGHHAGAFHHAGPRRALGVSLQANRIF